MLSSWSGTCLCDILRILDEVSHDLNRLLDIGVAEALAMKIPCGWCDTPLTPDNALSIGKERSGPGALIVHQTCWDQAEPRRDGGDIWRDGWRPTPPKPKAFTLIELLVVIAIIAIFAALVAKDISYHAKLKVQRKTETAGITNAPPRFKVEYIPRTTRYGVEVGSLTLITDQWTHRLYLQDGQGSLKELNLTTNQIPLEDEKPRVSNHP